jgi:heme/copper-type cytochrome/quinol oxidase subunit 2
MAGSIVGVMVIFVLAVISHCVYCGFFARQNDFSSGVRKLAYHCSLTLKIWVVLIPAVIVLGRYINALDRTSSFVSGMPMEKIILAFYGLILLFSFFFIYLTFYYVLDRSVSSRMMMEIERSPGGKLTFARLKELYDVGGKYMKNLDGMEQGGFIEKTPDEKFVCTAKGAFVGHTAWFFKRVLKLGPGG